MKRLLDGLSLVLAALFAAGALFHLAAILVPTLGNAASPARHAIFILINAVFAAIFFRRWRGTIVPVLVLTAQQGYSHGADLLRAHAEGRTDVQSLVVLLFLPVVVACAVRLARGPVGRREVGRPDRDQ